MAEKWIQKAIRRPGALTKKATAAGKSVSEFIKSPGKKPSTQTKRQINLAKTLREIRGHFKKKGK